MPVEFLSDEQAEAYGTFAEDPTRPELERFFFLDDVDRDLIALRRTEHHRLGFALQMCTVRYVGLFLEDPLAVPWPVVEHLAVQLGIEDASVVKRYTERSKTAYEHAWEIRDAYAYHPYEGAEWGRRFRTFLHGRAWTHAEGPKALFNHAVGWLRRHRVLLPGVSVLVRQVAEARTVAEKRLHATVAKAARRADPALPGELVATLKTPEGRRFSELERLRRPPTRTTGTAFARALERVDEIGAYRLRRLRLSQIPPNRMAALARYALGSKAPLLERASEPKRTAMLTAVMRHLEAKAIDEALDLFQVLMATRLLNTAKRKTEKERLSTLPQLEKASRLVARAWKVMAEELELVEEHGADLDVGALWAAVEEVAPRAAVMTAAATVVSLVPEDENSAEVAMRAALANRYATVRPFLALLCESKALDAASAGKRVLAGVRGLPTLARRKTGGKPLLPREVDDKLVPPAWRKAVYANPDLPQGAVDRDAVEENVLAALSLDMPVTEHLEELVRGLDAGWKQLAERLEEAGPAAKVSIEVQDDGRVKLNVDKLGALGKPKSLTWLRGRVEKMLPKIDLPDLLFEVNAWTGFLDAFVHLGDGTTRMKDLPTSLVALLVSEARNIGLTPVVNPGYEALTRARLVHVDQYYLRADTIAAANTRLITAQADIPIVQFWGEGLLASVDGLRFQVPVRTISAAPSPKYFGFKRGITWLNAVNDQVVGIGQMVVPGTPRDSLHILDALLNLDGGVKPEMVATDNASYSDMVFGLFKILGYNFSPRFRDLDDQRFWRATMSGIETGNYGPVEELARNRVNLNKVITHWPDMLKVAGSLVTNQVRAYDLLRMFGRDGRPTPLGAFAEYGRIAKTEHLLRVVDPVDDTYRRQMNRQLTVQESRHKLARDVCHGKRGTIHQAYRDGMEDQLGALGLVLNAIVLWTTKYIDAAVAQLRAEGHELRDEDIARLSPLKHRNLNLLGRYSFTASVPAAGALRPLRDPDAQELDEDGEDGSPG
ncbi:Tn3 family transposase [Streptomyces sp. NPDC087218]|uniref:Tn3 family transposase n=1 Tax=Streptomyces sp. NPDC087218 TaxID=3365769 RepID=UPI003817065E